MNLDDRSLREHLDRRAEAGASDVERIADVVMTRVAASGRGGWWRGLRARGQSLGVAVAAMVVLVVAMAVLPWRLLPGPGTSASPSGPAVGTAYPADRALTASELDAVLAEDPSRRHDTLVIAAVDFVFEGFASCPPGGECADFTIRLPTRRIWVHGTPSGIAGEIHAMRVRQDGELQFVGSVRPGPDGLAWSLPQLTAELPEIRAADRAVPYLYLVDAWRAVSSAAIPCPTSGSPLGTPDFTCGAGIGWLVPDEAAIPTDPLVVPSDGLRVPNALAPNERGYWLIDPFVDTDLCFMCAPAGAVDLIGRVPTVDELELMPPEAAAPPVGDYPTDRALTAHEAAELVAGFTGDGRHVAIVVEADMVPIDRSPECDGDYACPTWEIPVPGSEAIAVWATAGFVPNPDGPEAFTIVSDSGGPYGHGLNYVGPVMAGPDGFVWTLPQLLSDLPSLRPDGDFPNVYMVVAERVSTPSPAPCPSITPEPEPTFDCRTDLAWLVPEGTSAIDDVNGPEAGIRVPGATYMLDSLERRRSGLWLIDPVPTPSVCIACPPAGAAAMIGRLPSLAELGLTLGLDSTR